MAPRACHALTQRSVPYCPAPFIALHTRAGVSGMSGALMPSGRNASITAPTRPGVEAVHPIHRCPSRRAGSLCSASDALLREAGQSRRAACSSP